MQSRNHGSRRKKIENEIASFRRLRVQNPAISILPARQKQIHRQWADHCSRTTQNGRLLKNGRGRVPFEDNADIALVETFEPNIVKQT
jgi:hypothetical protein